MKQEFSEIAPNSRILLDLTNGNKKMQMGATIIRHLKRNIAMIAFDSRPSQVLKFDNIVIHVIYTTPEGIPCIWENCMIVYYQGQYLLQVKPQGGGAQNRRNCFRVSVSHPAKLHIIGKWDMDVIVHDISLTGFAIFDGNKELPLEKGDHGHLLFEDIGHVLDLEGNLVRIAETDDSIIYGFVTTRSCKDLSSYVNLKQRQKK